MWIATIIMYSLMYTSSVFPRPSSFQRGILGKGLGTYLYKDLHCMFLVNCMCLLIIPIPSHLSPDSLSPQHLGSDVVHSSQLGGGTVWHLAGISDRPPLWCGHGHHHTINVRYLYQWGGERWRGILPHIEKSWPRVW